MGKLAAAGIAAIVAAGTITGVGAVGCTNARTPAGHEGYIYQEPLWIGEKKFIGTQKGPTSTGLEWRYFTDNIDMRTKTYSENYDILSTEDLKVTFESHARIRLRPGTVKDVVELYGAGNWYLQTVKEPYRTAVRETVDKYSAYNIKDNDVKIGTDVLDRLNEEYANSPFEFLSIDVGNIDYPASINKNLEEALAEQQRSLRKDVENKIAKEEAKIRFELAKGKRYAQETINKSINGLYLQHKAVQQYKTIANSNSKVIIVVPTDPKTSGIPNVSGVKK